MLTEAITSNRQTAGLILPKLSNCFAHVMQLPDADEATLVTIFDSRLWQTYLGSKAVDPLSPYLSKIIEKPPGRYVDH